MPVTPILRLAKITTHFLFVSVPERRRTINFPSWGNPFRKLPHQNLYLHHKQPMLFVMRTATTLHQNHKTFKKDRRLLWLTVHLIGSINTDRVLVFVGTVFHHTYRILSKCHIMSSSLLSASSHVSA